MKPCFRWIVDKYDSDPRLVHDAQCACSTADSGCGNPWNLLSRAQGAAALKEKPRQKHHPCQGAQRGQVEIDDLLQKEEAAVKLHQLLVSDCWGVYTYDAATRAPDKVFYDYAAHPQEKQQEKEPREGVEEERSLLIEAPAKVLEELPPGKVLCVVMGMPAFVDVHIHKHVNGQFLFCTLSSYDH